MHGGPDSLFTVQAKKNLQKHTYTVVITLAPPICHAIVVRALKTKFPVPFVKSSGATCESQTIPGTAAAQVYVHEREKKK